MQQHSLCSVGEAVRDLRWQDDARCKGDMVACFAHECRSSFCDCDLDPVVQHCREQCEGCPVLVWCRYWTVVTAQQYGFSGGLSESERRFLRRLLKSAGIELPSMYEARRSELW
jgi:hypothetical protein